MRLIDFRSDTVTKPTEEMKKAMVEAELGDDVFGDDPTVIALEEKAAQMFGKEKALFVPSGTMGNQVSIKTHTSPGDEIILESESHIYLFEAGGAAFHSGVSIKPIPTDDGIMPLAEVERSIRPDYLHFPKTSLICIENTHNMKSGKIIPVEYMRELCNLARGKGIKVHLDGARIWNAHVETGIPLEEYARCADSVMACLSKGLSSPVGSIIMGTADFIERARKVRKIMGGGIRQGGILAACGLVSLDKMITRLKEDHDNARYLAGRLSSVPWIKPPDNVDTNIFIFEVDHPRITSDMVLSYLKENDILGVARSDKKIRFVTHKDITKEDIDLLAGLLEAYKV